MGRQRKDEDLRRAYWTEQMDAAYAFMRRMLEYPVQDCGEPLVSLRDAVTAVEGRQRELRNDRTTL